MASVGNSPKMFLKERYPQITRSHSSGTGKPIIPKIRRKKIPKYP
jgi:hypothetical protein